MAEEREKRLYRKIEVRMWGDEKFRALSPMPPSGQGLWFYLLTGPHTSAIPGLFKAGRAAMAEELDWEQEAFDEAFAEAFRQGMVKADWKARVVWVPKVINCNPPASPNVVKSWRRAWELLPECDLKREAYESLSAFVQGLGETFAKAFGETIGKPSAKTIGNQHAGNSRQVTGNSQESKADAQPTDAAPVDNTAEQQAVEAASLALAASPGKSEPVQVDLLGDNAEPPANPAPPAGKKAKVETFEPKSILLAAGVNEQIAIDWLALRKKKRADVTATTISGAEEEAGKAGMTLNDFLREWCVRGSQGLMAAWITKDRPGTPVRAPGFKSKQERAEEENARRRAERQANESVHMQPDAFDVLPLAIVPPSPLLLGHGQHTDDVGF